MKGINVTQEDGFVVCHINELSEEIKGLIRSELSAICHGKNEVKEFTLGIHSYKNTLAEFIKRYSSKSSQTKKGMMGEFIAHLVIDKFLPNLKKITIFFNKEEQSIRKGFDLTYVEVSGNAIWYGEVKSGETGNDEGPDAKNKKLLDESKTAMQEFLQGRRPNLWQSVIMDVSLSLAQGDRKKVKELLDGDITEIQQTPGTKKNAILVSVLFHDITNKISHEAVRDRLTAIKGEGAFAGLILFCIQKSTYSKIEQFLNEELRAIQQPVPQ